MRATLSFVETWQTWYAQPVSLGEPEVPGDRPPLALGADAAVAVGAGIRAVVDIAAVQEAVVLAVRGKDLTEAAALHHGLAHEAFRLHAAAVVGKRDDTWREPVKIREPLPFLTDARWRRRDGRGRARPFR